MDLKLKDILLSINTSQILMLKNVYSGEEFYPNYNKIPNYCEYFVTNIEANKDIIVISIVESL